MEVLPNLPKFQFFLESHLEDHFTRQGLKLCTVQNPASLLLDPRVQRPAK